MQERIELKPFFLDGPRGRRFCLLRAPPRGVPARGGLVCLPPFAEEMNKCRRMMALGASALAADGWIVLQPDLLGCGDSEGDFGDATWEDWVSDACDAARWLREYSEGPQGVWAVRAGALLVDPLLQRVAVDGPLLLWQPVVNGGQHLAQFRRMRMAADWIGPRRDESTSPIAEETEEIAGYRLSASVAAGLGASRFDLPSGWRSSVHWFEVSPADRGGALSPGGEKMIGALASRGVAVAGRVLHGVQFWQTVEVEICPALIDESVRRLAEAA